MEFVHMEKTSRIRICGCKILPLFSPDMAKFLHQLGENFSLKNKKITAGGRYCI